MKKKIIISIVDLYKTVFHKILFSIFKIAPINENKIAFITLHTNTFSGNNRLIYDELIKRRYDLTYKLFSMDDIKLSNLNIFQKFVKSVAIDFHICTARYVIINDYFSLFTRVKIRKETDLIQTWHGGGAFKKFGAHSMQNRRDSKRLAKYIYASSQYTKVIVSSKEVSQIYADSFSVDILNIYPIGLPRADLFFNEEEMEVIRKNVYAKYKQLSNKKIILYAPSFRDNDRENYLLKLNLDYIDKNLPEDYTVILKMHPRIKNTLGLNKSVSSRVYDLSHEEINDLLMVADILITDYSSLIFEYAILQKPMIFFAYDLEKYENELRGFYYPYKEFVPGPIAYTTEEIVEYIQKDEWDFERIKEFAMKFNEHFDGKTTDRFIDDVLFEGHKKFDKKGE